MKFYFLKLLNDKPMLDRRISSLFYCFSKRISQYKVT